MIEITIIQFVDLGPYSKPSQKSLRSPKFRRDVGYLHNRIPRFLEFDKGRSVNGRRYTRAQCYEQALECDLKRPEMVWNALGFYGKGGTVHGRRYSQVECYEKALEIDPKYAQAWYDVGLGGGGSVNGRRYTEAECYEQALQSNPGHTDARRGLHALGRTDVPPRPTVLDAGSCYKYFLNRGKTKCAGRAMRVSSFRTPVVY